MSDLNGIPSPEADRRAEALSEGGLRAPPGLSPLRKLWWWFDFLILVKLARLRFIGVLVAIGAVIAYWDTLHAYYDKWTRTAVAAQSATTGADTEYWCPMHPTIVREAPDKCPICGMPLSMRHKGDHHDDEPLPPGVVSRVQLTPYRVALAGIQTVEVGYKPLAREITTVGFVEFDERKLARISVRPTGKSRIDKLYVNVTGQTVRKGEPLALVYNADVNSTLQNLRDSREAGRPGLERDARARLGLWGIDDAQVRDALAAGGAEARFVIRSPINGHVIRKYQVEGEYAEEGSRLYDVADLSTVWIEAQVYEDDIALLRQGLSVSAVTKTFPNRAFPGKLSFIHPHLDAASRTLRVRFDLDNPAHELRPGMDATVTLKVPVSPEGGGPVLAVPERAVIDTGSRKLVYRESAPGVYDGVEVVLGPRCGDAYPVLRGLGPGDRVAAAGSFLIDAETRLTAGAGSTYFGASAGPRAERQAATTAPEEGAKLRAALDLLGPEDRRLAEAQKTCPISGDPLGTMGKPVKLTIKGETVFLCCKGCQKDALADPDRTLAGRAKPQAARRAEP